MKIELTGEVDGDGRVRLAWTAGGTPRYVAVLMVRDGAVPAYTAVRLAGEVSAHRIEGLSRHQRYRIAVLAVDSRAAALSGWLALTPRAGLAVGPADAPGGAMAPHVARVERVMVMPQDRRVTLYWTMTRGFADRVTIEVLRHDQLWHVAELDPAATGASLGPAHGAPFENGTIYAVRVSASFAGVTHGAAISIACVPAAAGEERRANAALPQQHLLFAQHALAPEIAVFHEDALDRREAPAIACGRCQRDLQWDQGRLVCAGCRAEYIPNGRGAYLDVRRLRFGTCRCCTPVQIVVSGCAPDTLVCARSGKPHVRTPQGIALACSPPVFDAAAIDDLIDAGLAEICETGVTARRRG